MAEREGEFAYEVEETVLKIRTWGEFLEGARVKVGLISDTHCPQRCPHYPTTLGQAFRGVDLILHAGDVGELWVLDALGSIAPVVAVHGNDDTDEAQRHLPFAQIISLGGKRLLLSHGHERDRERELAARTDNSWSSQLGRRSRRARTADADIFIHGHTHVPMCWTEDGVTIINPGAIASCNAMSRQVTQSVAILDIDDYGSMGIQHINLSRPATVFDPEFDTEVGFKESLRRFSESIVEAEIEEGFTQDWLHALEGYKAFQACLLRLSHECWRGERDQITANDVIDAVRQDPAVTENDRAKCVAAIVESR